MAEGPPSAQHPCPTALGPCCGLPVLPPQPRDAPGTAGSSREAVTAPQKAQDPVDAEQDDPNESGQHKRATWKAFDVLLLGVGRLTFPTIFP